MTSKDIQVPEGYKKTDLGIIPEEWNVGSIDKIAEINPKSDVTHLEDESIVTFLPMQNVGEDGRILKYEIRKYGEVKKGYTCFSEEDVLFAKITPCMENGKGALAINLENKVGFGSTEYHVLRAKQNGDSEFLFYLTKWDKFRKEAEKYMTGSAGQRRVSKNLFFTFKIPIPTLLEQQKIASILSKVDEQIEQTEQIIEKTELLKKGLMQKLLTKGIGHTSFKKINILNKCLKIPITWDVVELENITDFMSNGFVGTASPYYTESNDGVPYLMSNNVRKNTLDERTIVKISREFHKNNPKSQLKKGDMLTVQSGYIGTSCVVSQKYDGCNCHALIISRFKKERALPEYISQLLNSEVGYNIVKKIFVGSTVLHINVKDFKRLEIPLPPLEEQQKIASILSKVDSQIQDNQNYLTRLQELKKGLMQDLLTGKVRVCV